MIKPSFYDKFVCKADKCTDTCCAGWEIEIDDVSMDKYRTISSSFGKRIFDSIEFQESQPCFKRNKDDRCVFLDEKGLCDIYSELGESFLCDICREHPRFYDEYDSVVETGLGLCCEKVCEMLFENDFELIYDIDEESLEEDIEVLLSCRQRIIGILSDNTLDLKERVISCLDYSEKIQKELFDIQSESFYFDKKLFFEFIIDSYEKTEPINDNWIQLLKKLKSNLNLIISASDKYNPDSQFYSKVMSYIIYRHFMQVRFNGEILSVVRMALMAVMFMYMCECCVFTENNKVSLNDKINIIKLWSQQIEYSEENTNYCLTICQ